MYHFLFTSHQLMDIWVILIIQILWIMLLWTVMYKFGMITYFLFFWVYLLSRVSGSHGNSMLAIWGTIRLFSKVVVFFWLLSCSVMSDSLQPHGLQTARLLCPWGFSRGSSQSRDWIQVSHFVGGFFTIWDARKAHFIFPRTMGSHRVEHDWSDLAAAATTMDEGSSFSKS